MTKHYQVVSPDNFPIHHDGAIYRSMKQAKVALNAWVENYRAQGYYSQACSNGYIRRISVDQLSDYCEIKTI